MMLAIVMIWCLVLNVSPEPDGDLLEREPGVTHDLPFASGAKARISGGARGVPPGPR